MVKLSIRESLTVQLIRNGLSFVDYKLLAEWLDCYQYVLPADRALHPELLQKVLDNPKTPSEIFKLYLILDRIYSCLHYYEQERIISWMNDCNS